MPPDGGPRHHEGEDGRGIFLKVIARRSPVSERRVDLVRVDDVQKDRATERCPAQLRPTRRSAATLAATHRRFRPIQAARSGHEGVTWDTISDLACSRSFVRGVRS